MDPLELPHLKHGTSDFAALADAHAFVDSVRIPLHSHILSKSSNVFAQFFSSFHKSDDSTAADVTSLLGATTLQAATLAIFLIYNPDADTVRRIFHWQTWGKYDTPNLQPINAASFQETVELLDRLDATCVLDIIQSPEFITDIVCSDLVGWTLTGAKLHLPLRDEAVFNMLEVFIERDHYRITPQIILQDPRWPELSQDVLCMMLEALVVSHQGMPTPSPGKMAGWTKMGDLLANSEARGNLMQTHTGSHLVNFYQDLDEEAQHLQAVEDYGDEFQEIEEEEEQEEPA